MTGKLALDGGTPVLQRSDYKNWPIITADDETVNEVLDSGIVAGGTPKSVLEKVGTIHGRQVRLTTTSGTAAYAALAAVGGTRR
jgi:dTDP-4-amino-4,6-dideoxygalactose transaminase